MTDSNLPIDPKLDLVFEMQSILTPAQIWDAWTKSEQLPKWFCPRPWRVTECRIDLRPGGEFFTVMEGPKGEKFDNSGCYLKVIKNECLVWTNVLSKGFRPVTDNKMGFPFIVTLTLSQAGGKTMYRAVAAHRDEDGRKQHEKMGFKEGWGIAFKQLEEIYL